MKRYPIGPKERIDQSSVGWHVARTNVCPLELMRVAILGTNRRDQLLEVATALVAYPDSAESVIPRTMNPGFVT
jgi:hypothetical protein